MVLCLCKLSSSTMIEICFHIDWSYFSYLYFNATKFNYRRLPSKWWRGFCHSAVLFQLQFIAAVALLQWYHFCLIKTAGLSFLAANHTIRVESWEPQIEVKPSQWEISFTCRNTHYKSTIYYYILYNNYMYDLYVIYSNGNRYMMENNMNSPNANFSYFIGKQHSATFDLFHVNKVWNFEFNSGTTWKTHKE